MNKVLEKKLGDKWIIFNKLHQFIISLSSKIEYRLCTIYVRYMLEDNVIAVVYFNGKFVSKGELDIGFAFNEKPKDSNFINAKYMNYPNINYSIKLKNIDDITKKLVKTVKPKVILNLLKKTHVK